MEHLTPSQIQKILEDEATTLNIMQSKISNQIHLLQVEEELFRQELEKLKRNGAGKDYPNQGGVNQIVEVTDEDAVEEGNDSAQPSTSDGADGVKKIVEIANDEIQPRITATPEVPTPDVPTENADGVNLIVEIICDEDEIMRESNNDHTQGQASISPHSWSEQKPSNLLYQIIEPSSDDSETDLEDSSNRKERMLTTASPSDTMKKTIGAKRRRPDAGEPRRELNSEMEVEELVGDQCSPTIHSAGSPPQKKHTPRRKAAR